MSDTLDYGTEHPLVAIHPILKRHDDELKKLREKVESLFARTDAVPVTHDEETVRYDPQRDEGT